MLELGRARDAIPLLQEAIKLARPDRMDPSLRVDLRITLAMAMWAAGDRKSAKTSAEIAKTEATELGSKELIDQATAWLASHP